jgi:hemin uptake protein HemP
MRIVIILMNIASHSFDNSFQPTPDVHAMPLSPCPTPPQTSDDRRTLPLGVIPTQALFGSHQEVLISHNGEHYRLRITKNGKLILTK